MSDNIKFESLGPELAYLEAEIIGGMYRKELPKIKNGITWGGAGVIISKVEKDAINTSDVIIVTKFAREIAWYFYRIREIAYDNNIIDYNSKFTFYQKLASHIKFYENNKIQINSKIILLELLSETKKIVLDWDAFENEDD